MAGCVAACQVYPDKLCRAMLRGIRLEFVDSGIIQASKNDVMAISAEHGAPEEYVEEYYDDVSGVTLDSKW